MPGKEGDDFGLAKIRVVRGEECGIRPQLDASRAREGPVGRIGLEGADDADQEDGDPHSGEDCPHPRPEGSKMAIDGALSLGEDPQSPPRPQKLEGDPQSGEGRVGIDGDDAEDVFEGGQGTFEEGGESPEEGPGQNLRREHEGQEGAVEIAGMVGDDDEGAGGKTNIRNGGIP